MEEARKNYLSAGHNACPGCGVATAVRMILRAAGENVIVVSPTGCLETFTSPYGCSAWEVPWIHPLFENAPAVASGVEAALKYKGNKDTKILLIGGDGGTFDIGFGSLSGMLERNHDVLYICYDNEAYMNTGIQRSSATPFAATTTTTPYGSHSFGEKHQKKDLIEIVKAHRAKYVATTTIAYPNDLKKKVQKGLAVKGAAFIHMMTPCTLGWGIEAEETVEISRLLVETGFFPLIEYEDGKLVSARKIKDRKPVVEYLKRQKRFTHLLSEDNAGLIEQIQAEVDSNLERYGLLT